MEMFNNLKGLLSPTNLLGQHPHPSQASESNATVNYDAGAEILSHFQKQWEEMHNMNEDNAGRALKLAAMIAQLHRDAAKQNECVKKINQILSATPGLQDNIRMCMKLVGELHSQFEAVEEALSAYENLVEECEFEDKKRQHLQQFKLYEQKQLDNLEMFKSDLKTKHAQSIIELENKKMRQLEERQQVFQEAFKNDLETYKSLGTIPKIEVKQQPSALLEEIQLDIDDTELNKFLEGE